MKQILSLILCLVAFSVNAPAQNSDTFDIATFQTPKGWQKQIKDGAVIFFISNQQKGTYAMITLYGSGESSGNAKSDFENDWQEFIVRQLAVKTKPEFEPAKKAEGWEIITGGAAFENEMGTSAVILNTFSGYGKTFSLAAIFNSQDNLPAIEAFISSVKLKKPEANTQQTPANNTDNNNSSIVGTWGNSMTYNQQSKDLVVKVMGYGYNARQYTFNDNNTYSFVSKTFMSSDNKMLLVKENGTYQVSGNDITINPKKSVMEAWGKKKSVDELGRPADVDKWGKLLTTQNRPLEKVTYRFTKHYFSGIQEWNLVLQADKATQRDGPFSGNTTFSNAWYYKLPSSNNPVIELPR